MLKLNFYQLDRLIAILLPDLHTHLKVSFTSSLHLLGGVNQLEFLQLALLHYTLHKCLANANIGRQLPVAVAPVGLLHNSKLVNVLSFV